MEGVALDPTKVGGTVVALGNDRSGPPPLPHSAQLRGPPFHGGSGKMAETGNESYAVPPSEWLTYKAAGERLGLRPAAVAACARRDRWPMRKRNDTGEPEVEVPGVLFAADTAVTELGPDRSCVSESHRSWQGLTVLKPSASVRRPMPRSERQPEREPRRRSNRGGDWAGRALPRGHSNDTHGQGGAGGAWLSKRWFDQFGRRRLFVLQRLALKPCATPPRKRGAYRAEQY